MRGNLKKNLTKFNQLYKREEIANSELLKEIFDTEGIFYIAPPFYCKTSNLYIGKNVRINIECEILNQEKVILKENTIIAPRVKIVTQLEKENEIIKKGPITIEKNVWIGSCTTILPGVTIGMNSIIGAMSVIDRDVPPNVVVAGKPYKIIKSLTPYEIKE